MPLDRGPDERGILDGGGAEDDAVGSGGQGVVDGVGPANSAPDLEPNGRRNGVAGCPYRLGLASLPRPGPVEVDDVDPICAGGREPCGHLRRRIVVNLLAFEVAFLETDNTTAPQVDCGNDGERPGLAYYHVSIVAC